MKEPERVAAKHVIFFSFFFLSTLGDRPVDRYSASWATPGDIPTGRPSPPDGLYAGNGDITVMWTGNSSNPPSPRGDNDLSWQQWLWLSKNDMWGSDSHAYYPHLSAGRVGFLITPSGAGPKANGSATMFPGNASIVHTIAATDGSIVSGNTRVLENNVIESTIVCTSMGGGVCDVTFLLSDTDGNHFNVAQDAGAAPDGTYLWWRKENLHGALNPAYIGSCDPLLPLQSVVRSFVIDSIGTVAMTNGSCLWSDEASSPGIITVGDCTSPQGTWVWNGTSEKGDIVHSSSSACLTSQLQLGACGSKPWSQSPSGDANSSHVYLNTTGGCIVAIPDNNNNTLGVAVGIADSQGNLVSGTATRVSATDPSAGITLSLSLDSGAEYTLLVGLQTLRDIGCAGIRPQWEQCTTPPQVAAATLVQSMAVTASRAAAVQTSDAFWLEFWASSSIDVTSGSESNITAKLGIVERWYYFHQYLLACSTRDGKVTPALDAFVCIEPVPWGDQFTLDYNLEATFWGAGSSNRLPFIHPVMASATNPGAVTTARLRAQNPGAWGRNAPWPGSVGHGIVGATCLPDNCPNLTTTGFKGAEWPSAGMPLGDLRLADNDLQTRFTGGLLATNLIQYYEYSRNLTTLAQLIYPFVKDNAEFYLSYAITGSDGKLMFPYSCAQEGCDCRDAGFIKTTSYPLPNFTTACKSPNAPYDTRCPGASGWMKNHPCFECYPDIATGSDAGYHNAHPDIAFASSSFRNAVRFAKLLGVDTDMAAAWQSALNMMPSYPIADFTWVDGATGSEFNGKDGFFVEAEYGHHPGMSPNGTTVSPVTWPWCNKEYPIANFAAMWPTDEIGATQTTDLALLARAKQTVFGLNKYQARPWANTNGFCLSWPPAVRVSSQEDAVTLIDAFANAILSTTGNNACVKNNGGMLENIGATVAINDLLVQSHGGIMRFFPVWNATILGAASFTTLRTYGAFLVSASVDKNGTVSPITLSSDVGGDVVFASPWGITNTPKVTNRNGNSIAVTTVSQGVFSFDTDAGSSYTISSV